MVDTQILLAKPNTYGVRGSPLQLLRSYLDNRQQYVSINNVNSSISPIGMGVPQGSNLGPLLFLVFIIDIVKSSSRLKFNLFADDTSIYLSDGRLSTLYNVMNFELDKVCNWLLANRLALNVDKTVYLLFSGKKTCILSRKLVHV